MILFGGDARKCYRWIVLVVVTEILTSSEICEIFGCCPRLLFLSPPTLHHKSWDFFESSAINGIFMFLATKLFLIPCETYQRPLTVMKRPWLKPQNCIKKIHLKEKWCPDRYRPRDQFSRTPPNQTNSILWKIKFKQMIHSLVNVWNCDNCE